MVALLAVAYTTINVNAETTLVSDYSIGVIEWIESDTNTKRQTIIAYKLAGTGYNYRMTINTSVKSPYTIIQGKNSGNHYTLVYNSTLEDIIIDKAFDDYTRNGNTSYYYFTLGLTSDISNITWYGNQDDLYGANTYKLISDVDLPQGITIDDVNQAINDSLNKTTQTTIKVNNIINNTNNYYNQYIAGDISYTDLTYQINNNVNQLKDLNNTEGNTLADLIAINNGLTYNQIIQDTALADRNEAYWDSKDISQSVAESTIADDNDQKEYLNELTQETTQKLSDFAISSKINEQAKTSTVNILNVLYNNEILKLIIPIAATLMLVCIVLGIKYRL